MAIEISRTATVRDFAAVGRKEYVSFGCVKSGRFPHSLPSSFASQVRGRGDWWTYGAIEELDDEVMYLSLPSWAARSGLFECSLWQQFRGSELIRSRGSRVWVCLVICSLFDSF
jgi:hypothetical protein